MVALALLALSISSGQYTIIVAVIGATVAILLQNRSTKRTVNTIEVNTNSRLSESVAETKAAREQITQLNETIAQLVAALKAQAPIGGVPVIDAPATVVPPTT